MNIFKWIGILMTKRKKLEELVKELNDILVLYRRAKADDKIDKKEIKQFLDEIDDVVRAINGLL